jgi:hypothetical protein
MKSLKRILVLLLVIVLNISIVKAEEFIPHVDFGSFDGNYLTINLWYEGAYVSEIEHTIKYDYNYLELYSTSSDVYSANITNVESKDNYKIDKVYAIAMEDNNNATYATITFKVKDAFQVNKTMYLRFENIIASSSTNNKYKTDPLVVTIRRDSINSLYFYQEFLNDSIEKKIWLNDHIVNIVVIIGTIIVIIALFLIAPTNFANRKKTSVSLKKKINKKPKKKSIQNFDLNPDKISEIGRKKKPEPKNKLELGEYNPLAKNKGKRH